MEPVPEVQEENLGSQVPLTVDDHEMQDQVNSKVPLPVKDQANVSQAYTQLYCSIMLFLLLLKDQPDMEPVPEVQEEHLGSQVPLTVDDHEMQDQADRHYPLQANVSKSFEVFAFLPALHKSQKVFLTLIF